MWHTCTARTCAQAANALADDEYLLSLSSLGIFPTEAATVTAGSMRLAGVGVGVGVDERQAIDELQRELMRETGAHAFAPLDSSAIGGQLVRVSLAPASAPDASAMAFAAPAAASSSSSWCPPPALFASISMPAVQLALNSCERRILAQETAPRFLAPAPVAVAVCHRTCLLPLATVDCISLITVTRYVRYVTSCRSCCSLRTHSDAAMRIPSRRKFYRRVNPVRNYSNYAASSGFDASRRAARKWSAAMTEIADADGECE